MTRTDKATGEKKVIATRRMLQPSKHNVIESYEHGQDSVGAAFSHLMLTRGERRAAAIREARTAGEEPPKRRFHARTSEWRAAQELAIATREAAVGVRETQVEAREAEAEAEAVLCAAEVIGTGEFEIDVSGDEPDLRATPSNDENEDGDPGLPPALAAAPVARKRTAGLFAPMVARQRRSAQAEADETLTREVTELRKAWGTIDAVLGRLPASLRDIPGEARKSVTRSLMALRRDGGAGPDEKKIAKIARSALIRFPGTERGTQLLFKGGRVSRHRFPKRSFKGENS